MSLSFKVVSITESQFCGITVFDTVLKMFTSDEILTIRGRPWKVGTKVDFKWVNPEDNRP